MGGERWGSGFVCKILMSATGAFIRRSEKAADPQIVGIYAELKAVSIEDSHIEVERWGEMALRRQKEFKVMRCGEMGVRTDIEETDGISNPGGMTRDDQKAHRGPCGYECPLDLLAKQIFQRLCGERIAGGEVAA